MNCVLETESYRFRKERQDDLPINYSRISIEIDTARGRIEEEIRALLSSYQFNVPLWSITGPTQKYFAEKPIAVNIYCENNLFFAESETLVLFGMGYTPEEAFHDFESHVSYFYQYYKNLDWSQVTGEGRRLKEIYENLLIEESPR